MIGIDTNILLRWLLGTSASPDASAPQTKALEKLNAMVSESFFVNHVVLAETIWVLRRGAKLTRKEVVPVLQQLLETAVLEFEAPEIVHSALSHLKNFPGDFSDHLIGEINKQHGCTTTLTFDKAASKTPNFSDLTRY